MSNSPFTKNRKKIQKALASEGFIETIYSSRLGKQVDSLEIKETGKKAELKKIIINISDYCDIDDKDKIEIWRVNLEMDKIKGISTSGKKCEIALLVSNIKEHILYIILFKLKSNKTKVNDLINIKKKFEDSLSRIQVLLTINRPDIADKGRYSEITKIKPIGVVACNKIKNVQPLSNILNNDIIKVFKKRKGIIHLKTLIEDREKMIIKIYENPNPEFEINLLKDILKPL